MSNRQGQREFSTFSYDVQWLVSQDRFEVSPDLPLVAGFQARRAPAKADSNFHFALADTAPDAWGRRVIARAHAKERQRNPKLAALTELDYLAAVSKWRILAITPDIGMSREDLDDFAPAFEHEAMQHAREVLR